jgi:uncharacterized protein (TIGR01777 family)
MNKVLITGGTGLVGRKLSVLLKQRGYEVAIMSRTPKKAGDIPVYIWDPDKDSIDREAIHTTHCIIHLAGTNIGEKRWTTARKREIMDSRISSGRLILRNIDQGTIQLSTFITASATGYYGAVTSDRIFSENDPPSGDFLGQTCRDWEQVADEFTAMGIRTVKIRTGMVLSGQGGALSRLELPVKLGIGSAIGNGKQYMPWIHIDDLCRIYVTAMEDARMHGAYNAVAPEHVTNKEFISKLAWVLKKPLWFPDIPAALVRLLFGELSDVLLHGSRISSGKITSAGYKFLHPELDGALKQIYANSKAKK